MTHSKSENPVVRRLSREDAGLYREFALAALRDTPSAFISTYEEWRGHSIEWFKDRIASSDHPHDFLLGAFRVAGSELLGVVGLSVLPRAQERHKANLWGMVTAPSVRGHGVGKALMQQTFAEVSRIESVRQVMLMYSEGNLAAERLYRAFGFVPFGREPRATLMVDGTPVHKIHMVCMLDGYRTAEP